jgi:hypothetical protein
MKTEEVIVITNHINKSKSKLIKCHHKLLSCTVGNNCHQTVSIKF